MISIISQLQFPTNQTATWKQKNELDNKPALYTLSLIAVMVCGSVFCRDMIRDSKKRLREDSHQLYNGCGHTYMKTHREMLNNVVLSYFIYLYIDHIMLIYVCWCNFT